MVGGEANGLKCDSTAWDGSKWTGGTTYVLPGDQVTFADLQFTGPDGTAYDVRIGNIPTDAERGPAYCLWYINNVFLPGL